MRTTQNRTSIFQKRSVFVLILLVLVVLLLGSLSYAVTLGSTDISAADVYRVILYKLFGVGNAEQFGKGATADIVWFVRLPRIVLAFAAGMALSVCGVVMQAVVKNPLADPYILGISSGASLGAKLALLFGVGAALGTNFVGISAFLGALAASLLVLIIANVGGRANSTKLILAGMALNAVCSAFSDFSIYLSGDKNGIERIVYWLMGSLAGAEWTSNELLIPLVLLGTVFFWTQSRTLNLMLLGDDVSVTLGTNLHRWRIVYLLVSSLLIGFVVCLSGMIGFVGLIIPHVVRMVFGTEHRRLLPICALVGAIFLIWADVLCRIIMKGTELPIGILTSMIGAPCFIYLMIRKKYGFGGGD